VAAIRSACISAGGSTRPSPPKRTPPVTWSESDGSRARAVAPSSTSTGSFVAVCHAASRAIAAASRASNATRITPHGRKPTSMPVASTSAPVQAAYRARLARQSCAIGPSSSISICAPITPAAAHEAPSPQGGLGSGPPATGAPRSTTQTEAPRFASASADAHPITPAPITKTSAIAGA
jgi:hypothetical protein